VRICAVRTSGSISFSLTISCDSKSSQFTFDGPNIFATNHQERLSLLLVGVAGVPGLLEEVMLVVAYMDPIVLVEPIVAAEMPLEVHIVEIPNNLVVLAAVMLRIIRLLEAREELAVVVLVEAAPSLVVPLHEPRHLHATNQYDNSHPPAQRGSRGGSRGHRGIRGGFRSVSRGGFHTSS
jgi:hypothetical protein